MTGGLAPVEFSLFGLGLVGESVFLCGVFGLACGFCSCINSLGATGFLIPDGTPGRLLERFGPLIDLVEYLIGPLVVQTVLIIVQVFHLA